MRILAQIRADDSSSSAIADCIEVEHCLLDYIAAESTDCIRQFEVGIAAADAAAAGAVAAVVVAAADTANTVDTNLLSNCSRIEDFVVGALGSHLYR